MTWANWSIDNDVQVLAGTEPAAVAPEQGRIELFVCNSSHNLMWKTFGGSSWSAWSTVISGCYSTPSAAAYRSGTGMFRFTYMKVATLSASQRHQVVSGNYAPISLATWDTTWTVLSSAALSAPSVRRNSDGGFQIWGKGSDGNAYYAGF